MNTAKTLSALALVVASLSGCSATTHPVCSATVGTTRPPSSLETQVDEPGPLTVDTVVSATWEVDRSGLVDLDDPRAKAAHVKDGLEPIDLFIHVVRHPTRGTFLIDSGVERAFVNDPGHAVISGTIAGMAHLERMTVYRDMASVLKAEHEPVRGVFLTHLHLDHVLGMRDVPATTPVYVGAGDADETSFMNIVMQGVYDRALEGKGALREIHFEKDPEGVFDGVLDVFGDGSFWAISVPGHTRGSIAFLARTTTGPVLLTGDACHTAWGWEHGVGPGTFSEDVARAAESLSRLEHFAARHPGMDVRLGHQKLPQ